MKKTVIILMAIAVMGMTTQAQDIVLKGKELFGNMQARHIGPAIMSGRIIDLETHPTNNKVIYAGTAGGGVWKSSNGGASFTPIFDQYAQSIGKVAVDPKDPDNTIWVGTGEIFTRNSVSVGDGLYKSIDGGTSWKKMGFDKSERISNIVINPENTQEMYVSVLGALWGDSEERGVYKSTDGGSTWDKVLYIDQTTGCADFIMDPKNPNVLYASMWEFRRTGWGFNSGVDKSALYKSTDAGATWNKIHNGFPSGKLGRIAVAAAPSDGNILYAVLETEKKEDKGLYRSDDAGKSWTHLNKDFGLVVRPFYFSRLVVDPKDPEVVVKAGVFGSISRDGGKTFKGLGRMHPDIHDILFDINNSDRMYVATDGGLYRTWDGTSTMEMVSNLPISQFYHISVDNAEPYNIYGGLQDNGSWYGPSSSPGGIEGRDWNVIGYGDGFRVLKHPTKEFIYTEMQGAENVWRYDIKRNQTKTIQPLPVKGDPKLRFNWNAPMALSANNPDRFYMGSQFVYKSDDMGETWEKISPDLTTNDPAKQDQESSGGLSRDNSGAENHCTIFTIAESDLDENVIWVGTDDGNIQVTQDGGKSWTNTVANIPNLPANTWCYHIEASVHDKGTAYGVFEGHTQNDGNTYVYKTTDFGKTWKSIVTDEVYGFARNIQEDYENKDLLFLGTEFGLYITVDGGKKWNKFTNNMPAVAVHHIELQKQTSDIVMGTHGRGIIIIDDISPLRQINQEVLKKNVHFFDTKDAVMPEQSGFGGTATELEFVGHNPSKAAKVIYYLKKRHIFGKMKMEVQDMDGNKILDLNPQKTKGINIVRWNYRMKSPKMAAGKTFTRGGFTAPRVLPGKYKIVMTKGKSTFDTEIEVLADPNSIMSDSERKVHYKTTMELHDMAQRLAYVVYEIDESIAAAKGIPNAAKATKAYIAKMTALKEDLVVTKGDNYVGTVEPELREKLSELYAKVAGGYQPANKSELDNMALLEGNFSDAKARLAKIKAKEGKKLDKYRSKNNIEGVKLKSFDDFIKG